MKQTIIILCLALMPLFSWSRSRKEVKAEPVRPALSQEQIMEFDSLYFGALSCNLQGRPADAFEWVEKALAVDSLSAPALYLRSRLYRAAHNPNGLRDAVQAASIDTTNYWYGQLLGELYLERGRFDLAIPCYERLKRQNPNKPDPCYVLAELYMRQDSLGKCLSILDRIEELDGVNPNLTLQKFYILKEQGKTEEAFDEYRKLIKRYPFDISYRLQMGELQMKSGMIPQAKETYDEAAKIDPDNAYLWVAQSNYYSITGNQVAADSLVQQALTNVNLDVPTKIDILTEYLKTSLRKVAKEKKQANDTTAIELPGVDSLFQTVAMMHPTAAEVYDLHSDYLSAIGHDSLARQQMQFAVDLKPSEARYWAKLLNFTARADDFAAVFRIADEAQKLHPSLTEIYLTKAYAYNRLDKKDSTLVTYQEALANIDQKQADLISSLYGYMGDIYHEMNNMEECYKCYDKSLQYNDRNYTVLNNYAYFLCEDGGDLMKAESMAAKVIQQYPDEPTYLDTYAWIFYLQGNYTLAKFYQQKAMDKSGDHPGPELVKHYDAILKALNE